MRKRRHRLLVLLVLLFAAVYVLRYSLNQFLGAALIELFEEGTGCKVALSQPSVGFLPLRARVRDVFIQHPKEESGEGLRVGEITVLIDYGALLDKRVLLKDLKLKQARIVSQRKDSSFRRLIDFIVEDVPKPPEPPDWHDFISKGWKVSLKNLEIFPKRASDRTFVFATEKVQLVSHGLHFLMERDNPYQGAYQLQVGMLLFSVLPKNASPVQLGRAKITGEIGNGRFNANQIIFSTAKKFSGTSKLTAHGIYEFDSEILDFDFVGNLTPDYLKGVLPQSAGGFLAFHQPGVSLNVRAAGSLDDPKVWGEASLKLAKPLSIHGVDQCGLSNLDTKFALDSTVFTAEDIEIDDLMSGSNFAILFDDQLTFRGKGQLVLDAERMQFSQCLDSLEAKLSEQDSAAAARLTRIHATMKHAIANARLEFDVSGAVEPLALSAELKSDLAVKTSRDRSLLKAQFWYEGSTVGFELEEQGRYEQVQHEQVLAAVANKTQTAFVAASNSNINAAGQIDLVTGAFELSRLVVERFPLRRLLARVAPFVSDDQFSTVWDLTRDSSLLSADFALKQNNSTASLEGQGGLEVDSLNLAGIGVEHLSAKLDFGQGNVSINDLLLLTQGGVLRGEVGLRSDRTISGVIHGDELTVERIEIVENLLPGLQGDARLLLEIAGAQAKPQFQGALTLHTTLKDYSFDPVHTEVLFESTDDSLNLTAELFSGIGKVDAQIPLRGDQSPVSVNASIKNFPLRVFFVSDLDTTKPMPASGEDGQPFVPYGALTATLNYEGLADDFFQGAGKLVVQEMTLFDGAPLVVPSRPLEAEIKGNQLLFTNVELFPNETPLKLVGHVDRQGWRATLNGNCNVAQLLPFFPALEHAEGEIETELDFVGELSSPDISGSLSFHSGALSIPMGVSVLGLREIEMQARFVNSSIFVDSFTGKIGAGQLVGRLQATEVFDPMRTNVTVIGGFSNVYLEPLDQLSMVVEGETRLNYEPEGGQRIEGDIRLLSLLYENNLSLKRVLAIAKDYMAGTGMVTPVASTIRTKDESVQTKLDLHVSAENNLIVDTSFAQAEMRSELWIRGTPEHPLVQGSVSVIDGGYGFRSSHFDIVRGEVAFTEKAQQSDPKLDFLAESTATAPSGGEYRIQMFIRGTLSEPEVSFASDGGLSQNQVVQLLGAGANLDALSFSAGGSSSENLFDLINPASDITLDNRLKGLAGFSDISIAPSVSAATGELVPKVMAVRPLMRQVDLQLQTQLSRDPESEATIKYPLTPYLRLIAGWQNRALTEDVDTTSGAWLAGVGFKKSFPGTSILPFAED